MFCGGCDTSFRSGYVNCDLPLDSKFELFADSMTAVKVSSAQLWEICPSTLLSVNSVTDIGPRRTLGSVTNTRSRRSKDYAGNVWTYCET